MRYCVYIHYRPDTNLPFYVGKSIINECGRYRRAYTFNQRNNLWNKIWMKNNKKFIVQEIFYTDDEQECLNVESSLIRRFGCIFDKSGILANMVEKSSKHNATKRKIFEVDDSNNIIRTYSSTVELARELSCDPSIISAACRKRSIGYDKSLYSRKFTYIITEVKSYSQRLIERNRCEVLAKKDDTILSFDSILECCTHFNISKHSIYKLAKQGKEGKDGWSFYYKRKPWAK